MTEQIRQYQSLIGQLAWGVTLGRLDIAASVMTMSRFRQAHRVGHLRQGQFLDTWPTFHMVQSGTGPMSQTTPIYPTTNMTGQDQFMQVQEKNYHITFQNRLEDK